MKIKLSDIDNIPCDKYRDHIIEKYGAGEFDPIEVFAALRNENTYNDIFWLMRWCWKARTPEMFECMKMYNPIACGVGVAIVKLKHLRTFGVFEYYMSLDPSDSDWKWLMSRSSLRVRCMLMLVKLKIFIRKILDKK